MSLGAVTLSSGLSVLPGACQPDKQLGIALVGLGGYATHHLAPALQSCQHCRLRGIVTGTPSKAAAWKEKHQLSDANIFSYEDFDKIASNKDIDIVYVVLPNSMHAEYTIRAARAGKHVICEKPMATSAADCEKMIRACETAGVKLQIGYRLFHEPHHLELKRLGQQKVYGPVKVVEAALSFNALGWDNWRFQRRYAGGGPLMDVGIYCLEGARYVFGEEPVSVTAQAFKTYPEKFRDIEETLFWQMEFPGGGAASCSTSYVATSDHLFVSAKDGRFGLNPAFGYQIGGGYVNNLPLAFPERGMEQSAQMDAFALNILENTPVLASGEQGLRDLRIIEAVYKAMETGQKVRLAG